MYLLSLDPTNPCNMPLTFVLLISLQTDRVLLVLLISLEVFNAPYLCAHAFVLCADFALNLECLEAQFYVCATTGQPLPANLTGNALQPIGCQQANLTNPDLVLIAAEIAKVRLQPSSD